MGRKNMLFGRFQAANCVLDRCKRILRRFGKFHFDPNFGPKMASFCDLVSRLAAAAWNGPFSAEPKIYFVDCSTATPRPGLAMVPTPHIPGVAYPMHPQPGPGAARVVLEMAIFGFGRSERQRNRALLPKKSRFTRAFHIGSSISKLGGH